MSIIFEQKSIGFDFYCGGGSGGGSLVAAANGNSVGGIKRLKRVEGGSHYYRELEVNAYGL